MFREVYNVGNLTECFPAKQTLLATAYEIPAKPGSISHAFSLSFIVCLLHTHILKFKNWFEFKNGC